ncbi:hypothetical protein Moror_9782 [Moniliophthora roreri MCA 2997]|uniref:Uncharacterized protein n=1 Tax=Moniliophthora roreri (strain MCA 2997) TaxID=1381753 RepID=V2Y4I6_MONRO|nr:hypothetical protein Moror_9782 [Moniliophthora roreri MCA 2997]
MSTFLEPSRPFHIERTLHDTFVPALADLVQYPSQSKAIPDRQCEGRRTVSLETGDLLEWHWKWGHGELFGKHKSQEIICTIESIDWRSKVTGAICEGEEVQRFWEGDFQKLSCFRKPGAQLLAINRSEIQRPIFHRGLLPLSHFYSNSSVVDLYWSCLTAHMELSSDDIWMDTASGTLINGPDGPVRCLNSDIIMPPTADMLKDDTCLRFFSKLGTSVDDYFLGGLFCGASRAYLDDLQVVQHHQFQSTDNPGWTIKYLNSLWRNAPRQLPMDAIGSLRFDTIYSSSLEVAARWPTEAGTLRWSWCIISGLANEILLDNGLTRYELKATQGERVYLSLFFGWKHGEAWLSQFSQAFDVLDMEDKKSFFLVNAPYLELRTTLHEYEYDGPATFLDGISEDCGSLAEDARPIYLFLDPLPMSISELVSWNNGPSCKYFWSFNKNGQSRLSKEECEQWHLPTLSLEVDCDTQLFSWSADIYIILRDWQAARGFDLATADWARELGYPELEFPWKNQSRFEEIMEGFTTNDTSELSNGNQLDSETRLESQDTSGHTDSPNEDQFNSEANPGPNVTPEDANPPNWSQSDSGSQSSGDHRPDRGMFNQASRFTVTDGNFTNVQGDQITIVNPVENHSGLYVLSILQSVQFIQFNLDRNAMLKLLEEVRTFSYSQLSSLASSFDRSAINVLLLLAAYRTFQPQITRLIGGTPERQLVQ